MLLDDTKIGVVMTFAMLSGLCFGQAQTQPVPAGKRMVFTSNSSRTARVNSSASNQQARRLSTAPIVFTVPVPPQPKPEPVPAGTPKPVVGADAGIEPVKPAPATAAAEPSGVYAVDYKNGQLSVVAEKAELGKVLQMLGSKTGASVEVAPEIAAEPVVAHLGPGTPTQIIGQLLDSAHLEYIVMGSDENGVGFKRIVVRRRSSFARQPLVAMKTPAAPAASEPRETQELQATSTPSEQPHTQAQQQDSPPQR